MLASRECDLARAIRAIETRSSALASAVNVDARETTLRKLEQSIHEAKRMLRALESDDERFAKDERRVAYSDALERAERELSFARDRERREASARGATSGGPAERLATDGDTAARASGRARVAADRVLSPVVNASNQSIVSRRSPKALSANDQGEIRRQRAIQEGLTDEMAQLASGLKANALALERGLGRSTAVLEQIETRLERNVAGARHTTRRQTAAYRANRHSSCWTWLILALVGVLFAWTYVAIKLSSDRTRVRARH